MALSTYQIALQKILLQPFEQSQKQAIVEILKLIYGLMAQPTEWYSDGDVDKSFHKISGITIGHAPYQKHLWHYKLLKLNV